MIEVKFEGIDYWNRPVFKDINSNKRFGSVDILFNDDTLEKDVLARISSHHLCYFGNSFGCEPMGNNVKVKIIRSA